MIAMNLDGLSAAELKRLIADAQSALARRIEADKAEALARLKAMAIEYGFTLEDLLKNQKKTKKSHVGRKSAQPHKGRHAISRP